MQCFPRNHEQFGNMRVSCVQCYKSGKVLVSKCAESRLLSGLPKKKQHKKEITLARNSDTFPCLQIFIYAAMFFWKIHDN